MKFSLKDKKTIIIAAAAFAVVAAALAITLILALGGNSAEKLSANYSKSMNSVVKITEVAEIREDSLTVYEKKSVMTIKSGNQAEVVTTERKLDGYHIDFVEETSTEEGETDRKDLAVLNFDLSLFENGFTYKKGEFSGTVKAENLSKLFNRTAPKTVGDVSVKAKTNGKKIVSLSYEYKTDGGRLVVVGITYDYKA